MGYGQRSWAGRCLPLRRVTGGYGRPLPYFWLVCGCCPAARTVGCLWGIAVWLTLLLTNTPMQWLMIEAGHAPTVTPVQVHIYTILNWALLGLAGLLGVLIFIRRWRRATTRD